MRVGIVSLMHESNTFAVEKTPLAAFQRDRLLTGEAVREQLVGTHHEVGGFFDGLAAEGVDVLLGRDRWVCPGLDRMLFRGQPERIPPHRVQDVLPLHAVVSYDDIGGCVPLGVPHMQP
jgi:microcystin degradation protein MlrC